MSKSDQQDAQSGDKALSNNVNTDTSNVDAGISSLQNTAATAAGSDYNDTKNRLTNAEGALAPAGTDLGSANSSLSNANSTLNTARTGLGGASDAASKMATTGGFTDADKTAYLNQATSGVKNSFDVLGQQAKLNQMRTGAASGPAAIAQIARQGGQAQADAQNTAQVGLNSQINANKNTGIGELTGANAAIGNVGGQQTGVGNAQTGVGQAQTGISNAETNVAQVNDSLFNTNSNTVTTEGAQLLQSLGLKYSTQAEAQQLLSGLASQTKGPLDNILNVANLATGHAATT